MLRTPGQSFLRRERMSLLLINESPLQVLPTLAVIAGLHEAIIIQQVHFRSTGKKKPGTGGHKWIWDSYEMWKQEHFPFWSIMTIRRNFESARIAGFLICKKERHNGRGDHRLSWRVDYKKLEDAYQRHVQNEQAQEQSEQPEYQNEQAQEQSEHNNVLIDSPETYPENSQCVLEVASILLKEFSSEYFNATGKLYKHGTIEREHLITTMREYNLDYAHVSQYFQALGVRWKRDDSKFWPKSILKFDGLLMARLDGDTSVEENEMKQMMAEAGFPDWKPKAVNG